MIINLLEIPEEGKQYICNEKTGDLNQSLKDLIGNQGHNAEFFIRPMQPGTYELRGFIKTKLPEDCSRCGVDFDLTVEEKFMEILIPEQKMERTAKYAKTNHVSDMANSGPETYEYKGHHFNAGDYLHEVVGLSEPLTPAPACDAQGNCSLCHKNVGTKVFAFEEPGFEKPSSPFEALKDLKLTEKPGN